MLLAVCMLKKFKYLKGLFGTYVERCLNKNVMRVKDMFMRREKKILLS